MNSENKLETARLLKLLLCSYALCKSREALVDGGVVSSFEVFVRSLQQSKYGKYLSGNFNDSLFNLAMTTDGREMWPCSHSNLKFELELDNFQMFYKSPITYSLTQHKKWKQVCSHLTLKWCNWPLFSNLPNTIWKRCVHFDTLFETIDYAVLLFDWQLLNVLHVEAILVIVESPNVAVELTEYLKQFLKQRKPLLFDYKLLFGHDPISM